MTTQPKSPSIPSTPNTNEAPTDAKPATSQTEAPKAAAPEEGLKAKMAEKRRKKEKQPKPETAAAAPAPAPANPNTDDDDVIVRTQKKPVTAIRVGLTSAQVAARAKQAEEAKAKQAAHAAEQAAKMEALKEHLRMMEVLLEKGERTLQDPTRKNYNGKCCVDRVSEVNGEQVLVFHGVAYPVCAKTAEAGKIIFSGIPHKERSYRARRLLLALNLEEAKQALEQDLKYEAKLQEKFEAEVLEKFQAGISGKPGINGEVAITAPASRYVNFESNDEKNTYLKLLQGKLTVEQDGQLIPVPAPKDECNPSRPITHVAVVGANLIPEDEELKVVFCTQKTAEALKSLQAQGKVDIKGGVHALFTDKEREEITLFGLAMGRKFFITQRGQQ